MYGTIVPTFAKCRSHACGFTRVQSYTDQDMSSLSDRDLAYKRHCCCCFISLKLHFNINIKTQKNYCNNHSRTVFFIITRKKYRYPSISLLPVTIIFLIVIEVMVRIKLL